MPPQHGPLSGISLGRLLSGVQTGPLDIAAQVILLVAATLYLAGVGRVAGRGDGWHRSRTFAFLGGAAVLWIAIASGLAGYDDSSVTLHVVQHILLMMIAPALFVLGRPVILAAQALPRRGQLAVNRFARSRLLTVASHPLISAIAYFGVMFADFMDKGLYAYLQGHPVAHDGSHLVLVMVGTLYWMPLVSSDSPHRWLGYPGRVVAILVAMPFEAITGVWVRFQTTPIDPANTVADTQLAGEVFWVVATLTSSAWLVVTICQWYRHARREEIRQLGRDAASPGEWSVPWWLTAPAGSGE